MNRSLPIGRLGGVHAGRWSGALGFAGLLGGCYVDPQPMTGQPVAAQSSAAEIPVGPVAPVYFQAQPPPAPRWESRPASPFLGAVWCDGFWSYQGGQASGWTWISGRWTEAHAGYVYAPPRYQYAGGRVEYLRPHWQPESGPPAPDQQGEAYRSVAAPPPAN